MGATQERNVFARCSTAAKPLRPGLRPTYGGGRAGSAGRHAQASQPRGFTGYPHAVNTAPPLASYVARRDKHADRVVFDLARAAGLR